MRAGREPYLTARPGESDESRHSRMSVPGSRHGPHVARGARSRGFGEFLGRVLSLPLSSESSNPHDEAHDCEEDSGPMRIE